MQHLTNESPNNMPKQQSRLYLSSLSCPKLTALVTIDLSLGIIWNFTPQWLRKENKKELHKPFHNTHPLSPLLHLSLSLSLKIKPFKNCKELWQTANGKSHFVQTRTLRLKEIEEPSSLLPFPLLPSSPLQRTIKQVKVMGVVGVPRRN